MKRVLIVGAGFSGAVLARRLAEDAGIPSLVIDSRDHVAGNCHTARDEKTGVMMHHYGPHIFHTSRQDVWDYVQRFCRMMPFINRIKAVTSRGVFSLPINLHTINQFFGTAMNPQEARAFLSEKADHRILKPSNFEEQALSMIGKELYETLIYGYTRKQWGCEPRALPASILKRLPVRFDYNDNYYHCRYQGIPEHGYTDLVSNILDHDMISLKLACHYEEGMRDEFAHVFYTGPIDSYFNRRFGMLGYRTINWEIQRHKGDFQGNPILNYSDINTPHTRILEPKHFTSWEHHDETVVMVEFSKETTASDIPYYPKRLNPDLGLLDQYIHAAELTSGVSFLGRLGTYRYMDMHQVIGEALDFGEMWLKAHREKKTLPVFPKAEPNR